MEVYNTLPMPYTSRPATVPLMVTLWTGLIGVMKSALYGVREILVPVSRISSTMSGDIGVME
jgi:hypothetical protein